MAPDASDDADDNAQPVASTSTSTSSISITSLAGSQTSSRALCNLLEFDDAKILLDCGVNASREEFTYDDYAQDRVEYLEKLKALAPQLTLVLLSAPTVETLGLLPYLVTKLRLACPIYATFPCRTLGQLTLEEWAAARSEEEGNPDLEHAGPSSSSSSSMAAPSKKQQQGKTQSKSDVANKEGRRADDVAWRVTKEEIQTAFSRITPVVYSQVVRLSGRSNSPFSLLAHPAGTYLGGTLWSLRSATTDSLLYSPFFNHVNERTLDLAAFMIKGKDGRNEVNEALRRIGILVIGSERSLVKATKAKERDRAFLELINATMHAGGSIFVPTDTAGRFLELLVLLEQHWSFSNLSQAFPLCLLAKNGEEILFTIRRLADALGGQLGGDENERERVLRFRNVRIVESAEQLNARYPSTQPKLVLAAPSSLSYGCSRQIIVSSFLSQPNSLVLLTSPGQSGSLAAHLFELWNDRQPQESRYGSGKVGNVVDFNAKESAGAITSSTKIRLKMRKKVVLQGEELMAYLEEQRVTKEKEQKARAMAERNRRMMEADDAASSSDDDDSSDEEDAGAGDNLENGTKAGDGDENSKLDLVKPDLSNADQIGGSARGQGIGPASFVEPGSGPSERTGRRGVARYGIDSGAANTAAFAGAWDEFLDDDAARTMGGFDIYVRPQLAGAAGTGTSTDGSGGQFGATGAAAGGVVRLANITNQQARHRMFPFFERRRKVDGYGEVIDIEGWKTRNKPPEEVEAALAADAESALGKRKRQQEEEEKTRQEPPHKFVVEDITVQVKCKLLAIDMEGKADGRALRSILPLIEPKKLVLINGDVEATQDLADALQAGIMDSENVFMPSVGDKVKIADVTKSFSVRLDDSLMTALALRKIDEYEVVPIRGVIGTSDESTIPVLIPSSSFTANITSEVSEKDEARTSTATKAKGATVNDPDGASDFAAEGDLTLPELQAPHFIGDIKLAILKNNLTAKNVPVSFHKGSLICGPVRLASSTEKGTGASTKSTTRANKVAKLVASSSATGLTTRASPTPELAGSEDDDTSGGKVIVRKDSGNNLILEGAPGDTFYSVREAIYAMHAVAS